MQISSLFTEVDFVAVFINNRVNFQSYVASFKLLDQFFLVVLSKFKECQVLDGNCTLKKMRDRNIVCEAKFSMLSLFSYCCLRES